VDKARDTPPPINGEQLRSKAIEELLKLIAHPTRHPRADQERPSLRPFLLPPKALMTVIPDDPEDDTLWSEPAEYRFARCLLAFDVYGVAAGLGLEWNHVLAGLVRLAMGQRLPTIEEVVAVRGARTVAVGR